MVDAIVLYSSTETDYSTMGLGTLTEAISCTVTEERNGEFELSMTYPITGKRYSDIALRNIIMAKPNPYDDPQPFRIYDISRPMNGIVVVSAAHISYDLTGYPTTAFTATTASAAFNAMKNGCPVTCPFIFTTDLTNSANMVVDTPQSIRSLLGGQEGSILDIYGGEYEFNRFNVVLKNHRGANNGVSIRYGKNLTDLEQEENCASVYTGVYPYFQYVETNAETGEEKTITIAPGIVNCPGTYNYTKIYVLDCGEYLQVTDDYTPTADDVKAIAKRYITVNKLGVPDVSIEVSFASLSQSDEYSEYAVLERVKLCDTVNVIFPELNVDATSKCIKTVYDCISGKYKSISLGAARSNLATTISSNKSETDAAIDNTKTFLEKALDEATKKISGNLGGYVVLHDTNGDGSPDELLIMDHPSIKSAVKVWRWNMAGIAYSKEGYAPDKFVTAWTGDGEFVADFIKAGTLKGIDVISESTNDQIQIGKGAIDFKYKKLMTDDVSWSKHATFRSNAAGLAVGLSDGTLTGVMPSFEVGVMDDKTGEIANKYSYAIQSWYEISSSGLTPHTFLNNTEIVVSSTEPKRYTGRNVIWIKP